MEIKNKYNIGDEVKYNNERCVISRIIIDVYVDRKVVRYISFDRGFASIMLEDKIEKL